MNTEPVYCLLLPYAGGSSYSYLPLTKMFPTWLNPIYVELPGRGTRLKEKPNFNLFELAEDVFEQVKDKIKGNYIIFGHSMGAILAYLFYKLIKKYSYPAPLRIFFSGREGLYSANKEMYHLMSSSAFRAKLRELGGCPLEILDNNDIMDFFEPIIRTDFKAVETFFDPEIQTIEVPVTIILGTNDFERETQKKWVEISTNQVDLRYIKGGHFFIFSNKSEVVYLLVTTVLQYT